MGYAELMAERSEILFRATGLDYREFMRGPFAFDYDAMMEKVGYRLDELRRIQSAVGVGNTPMLELRRITEAVRRVSPRGTGARIFTKDEACNPSGSFKDRRASVSAYHAAKMGYKGLIAATSGNYGAAVASQAAIYGLRCIVVQEVFDSQGRGQPEILEKGRKCEALGAEVVQTTVGPELFYVLLLLLKETGFFNASLYTPFSIAGIETLGAEIAEQTRRLAGRDPDVVAVTHAGGGNVTGTARGLRRAGCASATVLAVSVDLSGLHMASDTDFNRKSFTTGHTGFAMPFTSWPDRVDVPRNAARPMRYIDRFVTVTQGEVFYATEALAQLEGLERGPAGNTSLAAAMALAREMDRDQVLVVSETEYTGAGKHPTAQLSFAEQMGVVVESGDPRGNVPGRRIVVPAEISQLSMVDVDLDHLRESYVRRAAQEFREAPHDHEIEFLAAETRTTPARVRQWLQARSES
jgi:cysteine synthase